MIGSARFIAMIYRLLVTKRISTLLAASRGGNGINEIGGGGGLKGDKVGDGGVISLLACTSPSPFISLGCFCILDSVGSSSSSLFFIFSCDMSPPAFTFAICMIDLISSLVFVDKPISNCLVSSCSANLSCLILVARGSSLYLVLASASTRLSSSRDSTVTSMVCSQH